jgi:acetyltransferase-like isoleucine patch superfamily enzyme
VSDIHSIAHLDPTATIHDAHKSIFLNERMIRIGAYSRIDGMVKLEGGNGLTIGNACHIASFSHLNVGGGELVMGDHSGCSSHVVICSGMPNLDFLYVSAADLEEDRHPLRLRTVIGEFVVIFANATICPGVTIGDGAIIGAGAVVTRDIPKFAVAYGNPARVVRYRNSFDLEDAELYLARMAG